MYYSNEDFENFYVRYKAEGLPGNISIQQYCIKNKVSWNLFNKWYIDTRHRIKEVAVTGRPEESAEASSPGQDSQASATDLAQEPTGPVSESPRIMVDIKISNGLHVFQRNLNYRGLVSLVEKLEALCWM